MLLQVFVLYGICILFAALCCFRFLFCMIFAAFCFMSVSGHVVFTVTSGTEGAAGSKNAQGTLGTVCGVGFISASLLASVGSTSSSGAGSGLGRRSDTGLEKGS